DKGSNGVPDILDEARWGLEWLVKMNPDSATFFNQIADDRDHRLAVLPQNDLVDYGWGEGTGRPVYPCRGTPYGFYKKKHDSKGLASSVGKFASCFALGADIFEKIDPEFAALLRSKAGNAYEVAAANPGACQTAPCVSPYYYEEDNWADDMALAAMQMFRSTGERHYLAEAVDYGRLEPVNPWMGADSAHHYQWYPFINLGHYYLAVQNDKRVRAEFVRNMRSGLQRVAERADGNPFLNGIPFIWCSNNLTVAFVTQAMLYREITGDDTYLEIETAMRDWLFGVNPWGKCMIIGLPADGDYPTDPHSALSNLNNYPITGGLVDGPVYTNIFRSLRGVTLRNADRYAPFQGDNVVYHDDYSDYSTNEPTMDGTASTTIMLSRLARKALKLK
ncbi:MAG: glycoside hydrolase family 9 protein, partial [Bacteroidales bacterium]|nr:glycoside hydrolase family 9 protein [Bacteroidales bacterium]